MENEKDKMEDLKRMWDKRCANSCYTAAAQDTFPLLNADIAEDITNKGRELLNKMVAGYDDVERFSTVEGRHFINEHASEITMSEDNVLYRTFMEEAEIGFNKFKEIGTASYMQYLNDHIWPIFETLLHEKHKLEDMLINEKILKTNIDEWK